MFPRCNPSSPEVFPKQSRVVLDGGKCVQGTSRGAQILPKKLSNTMKMAVSKRTYEKRDRETSIYAFF